MLETIFTAMRTLAAEMEAEATSRRRLTPGDAAAEASDYWASLLRARVAELEQDAETLTPAQYATLHGVTEQTVRNWIRRGELVADGDAASGYRIARRAERRPALRTA